MFAPDKSFRPILLFEGKTGTYPSRVPFMLLASPTNIRQGLKGLKVINTLAYLEPSST